LREEIEKKIRLLELDNVVTLLGASDDVYSILSKADIFVLPSNYEGFPISIIEAMGTGLLIIASEVGGIPDMITDKYNGILCAPNAESICTSIEMFISDEHLRMSCGKNAMKIAQKNFSAVSMAQKYIDLYE